MTLPIDIDLYNKYGNVSSFLAANDFSGTSVFKGSVFNSELPMRLNTVTRLVQWATGRDSSDGTLIDTGNYMYALCGSYLQKAKEIIANDMQGVIVNPATGVASILAPFYIEFYVGVTASPITVNGASVSLPAAGASSMTIPLTYIKQSLEITADGVTVPRVATDRFAVNVNYTNNDATLTANIPFAYNQLIVIEGDQYQTV